MVRCGSGPADTSGAALACMRAALEAADLGAHGSLEKLGVRVPEPHGGLYHRTQFKLADVRATQAKVKNMATRVDAAKSVEYTRMKRYLEAYQKYQDQDNTVGRMDRKKQIRGFFEEKKTSARRHFTKCSPGASRLPLEVREPADWRCDREGLAYSSLDLLAIVR